MAKYQARPILVEADRFLPEQLPWPEVVIALRPSPITDIRNPELTGWAVVAPNGQRFLIYPGDWIVTEPPGRRFVCTPDVFEATYEAV